MDNQEKEYEYDYEILDEGQAKGIFDQHYELAEDTVNDPSKLELFMQSVEDKIKKFPGIGDKLADLVTMIDLVRAYFMKEYTDVPKKSIIAVVIGLIYWVSPVDLIPESIPGIGIIDDIAVLGYCANLVRDDLDRFKEWREYR